MNNNIIFIGGIHGVGKTSLCKYLSDKLKIENYSASELIGRINTERIKDSKRVTDIDGNQNVLLTAINLYLNKSNNYIIDGHFCLLDDNYQIKNIPIDTFQKLPIKLIVVLIDYPHVIANRIKNRDNQIWNIDFINEFQKKEIEYAKFISKQLNVRCEILDYNEKENITKCLESIEFELKEL